MYLGGFCLCFNGYFPAGPGLAGTRMSAFGFLMELTLSFLWTGCPSCRPTNSVKALLVPNFFNAGSPPCHCCGDLETTFRLEVTVRKPSHTWLRALETYLGPLNIGLASAWRKAAIREDWRRIVDTATLQRVSQHPGDSVKALEEESQICF